MQDLTLKIQRSHHVSQLMTIISQWKTAQNEAIKNLREQETIRRTATGSTAADAAVAGATIAGGTLLGTGFGLLLSPFTFGVSIPVGIAIGTAVGGASVAVAHHSIINAPIAEIDRKILEVNKKLQEFYHYCRETATNLSVTPKQVYAISLECIRESASTTEQITAIIRKYQNPIVANTIEGFGFLLSSDMLPKNVDQINVNQSLDIARKLENDGDKLTSYLKL